MKPDIEIARETKLEDIEVIREKLGIADDEFLPYGRYKGKITLHALERLKDKENGKLIVVTAITPTKYGEGKTTTAIGLSMGINRIGKKSMVTLREPSLGPVFGVKGGAAGGGYSQVLPMEEINLHFTGDIHAITTANNLLSAFIGNHIHYSNDLRLDTRKIYWKRAIDMNDRDLRSIVVGLGGKAHGYPREDRFIISAASEIMAILTLSENIKDLKNRMCNILIGFSRNDTPVYVGQLKVCGAMAMLLKDAIKPNLVQTIEHTPALIHSGPFANISFGTNSVVATKLALKLSDYVVTETGFGADLGFEKFVDLVSRVAGYKIHAVVIVATVRALKHQGSGEDLNALKTGLANLGKHIDIVKGFALKPIVAINIFPDDKEEELILVKEFCSAKGVEAEKCEGFAAGSMGTAALAEKVAAAADAADGTFTRAYEPEDPVEVKIEKVAAKVYGADGVIFSWDAKHKLKLIKKLGLTHLPVCIAKTQLSLSDNSDKLNVPTGWRLNVNEIEIAGGAGYLVPIAGDIMLMPGLPKSPSAEFIDIDDTGENVTGLF
ncbi:MAG: formate--tetrahydrofolate ligase [Acidobacteriota bacterium]|nr:formate--tetrahydrofolate ligase [Acidobacteriota bacterium]